MNGNPIQEVEIKDTEEMTYEITELSPSSSYVVYVMVRRDALPWGYVKDSERYLQQTLCVDGVPTSELVLQLY